MVDSEQGWIGKDNPIPAGIQFTRALEKYNLVDERIMKFITKTGWRGEVPGV